VRPEYAALLLFADSPAELLDRLSRHGLDGPADASQA